MADSKSGGALEGVRVIDLANMRAEMAGRALADMGADVLKIEPPEGTEARRQPPFVNGREDDPDGSLYWAALGRGKRSTILGMDAGKVRFMVNKILGLGVSEFVVRTKTAILGVRGSDFVGEAGPEMTTATAFENTRLEVTDRTASPKTVVLTDYERTVV